MGNDSLTPVNDHRRAMTIRAIPSSGGVEAAIRHASQATGVDFDFLLKTARRESSLNPAAKAPTSSAAGLFQFIEQTWLATVKKHGARHGYGQYADLIHQGPDGRWKVQGSARNVVLDLRFDPRAASTMAAELAASNAAYLKGRTGRVPTAGDLYAAHFLGPAGAADLMQAMATRPNSSAVALFPQAAAANRSIFYREGRAATVAELHANLQKTAGGASPIADAVPAPPDKDLALAARLDRLRQDQSVLALLLGQDGGGASFKSAFGAGDDRS